MSNQLVDSNTFNCVPSVKKNPKGKLVSSSQKLMIINVYKTKKKELPDLKYAELIQTISKITGIGKNTVSKSISFYKNKGIIKSPNKTKIRPKIYEKISDSEKNSVRKKVYNYWYKQEIPTLDKIITSVNQDDNLPNFARSSLHRILKEINFVYTKKGQNKAMIESDEIVIWRNNYIKQLRKYRTEGRKIYYLDETSVNVSDITNKNSFTKCNGHLNNKEKHLIAVHIGSEEGFVSGALSSFKSKKNLPDFHNEIDSVSFFSWIKSVVPLLEKNCVIIMSSVSCHSLKAELCPTTDWKKSDIEKWLEKKGEIFEKPILRVQLMEIVQRIKSRYDKCLIDEYIKDHNMTILRLPPYHSELNPMALAWSFVKSDLKTDNTTIELPDIFKILQNGIERCNSDLWKDFIRLTEKSEDMFWEIDFVVDEVMESTDSSSLIIKDEILSDSDSY